VCGKGINKKRIKKKEEIDFSLAVIIAEGVWWVGK
jgi:hypothetical protein